MALGQKVGENQQLVLIASEVYVWEKKKMCAWGVLFHKVEFRSRLE